MHGKSVLVTGAARRVGAEIARTLHAAGANVGIHYRRSDREALALADLLNAQRAKSAHVVHSDLVDVDGFPALVEEVVDKFGRLDGLVNNASSFFGTPMGRISKVDWDALIGSNLMAPLFLSQAAAPYLKVTRGAVVEHHGHSREASACRILGVLHRKGRPGRADTRAGHRIGAGGARKRRGTGTN